jgi:NTP pyrophosphatase (non-canonical NTP hydrolase)
MEPNDNDKLVAGTCLHWDTTTEKISIDPERTKHLIALALANYRQKLERLEEALCAREEVQWFATRMEQELRENDHKGGWQNDNWRDLLARLHEEMHELWHVCNYGANADIIAEEAADIANFAMMIADNARRRT